LHDDLGTVLVQKSDAQGAAAEIFRSAPAAAQFASAHFHLGVLRYQENLSKGPRKHLQTAIQLNSADPGGHYYLAEVLKSKGENGCGDQGTASLCCIEARLLRRAKTAWACCSSIAAKLTKPSKHFARP